MLAKSSQCDSDCATWCVSSETGRALIRSKSRHSIKPSPGTAHQEVSVRLLSTPCLQVARLATEIYSDFFLSHTQQDPVFLSPLCWRRR